MSGPGPAAQIPKPQLQRHLLSRRHVDTKRHTLLIHIIDQRRFARIDIHRRQRLSAGAYLSPISQLKLCPIKVLKMSRC